MRITVKHQLTLSEQEECWEFLADTARDSSSEGKHRSELDLQKFSNTERNRFSQQRVAQKSIPNCREGSPGRSEKKGTSTRYKAEMVRTAIDPEKLVCAMIATEIRPRRGGHRDDGHEEEILHQEEECDEPASQVDSDQKEQVPDHWHG